MTSESLNSFTDDDILEEAGRRGLTSGVQHTINVLDGGQAGDTPLMKLMEARYAFTAKAPMRVNGRDYAEGDIVPLTKMRGERHRVAGDVADYVEDSLRVVPYEAPPKGAGK